MNRDVIKVLVVDDSALMRRLLGEVFDDASGFQASFARSGVEALSLLKTVRPDVVTLDVHMPQMDGLETLDRIMAERPCPVVMISSLTAEGADVTLEAMDRGAVDFVPKPAGAVSLKMAEFAPQVRSAVGAAAKARVRSRGLAERVRRKARAAAGEPHVAPRLSRSAPATRLGDPPGLVLIGSSTGGPPALDTVLSALPAELEWPVLIAQHMPASFTGALARRLSKLCPLPVVEVTRPTLIEPGLVYVAKGDADMIVSRRSSGLTAAPAPSASQYRWHPSVDRLVDSAMTHVPAERLVGVLLTGMGDDGAAAMTRLRAGGGRTIAEAEATAVVWGMPGELVKAGGAERVEPIDRVGAALVEALAR